MGLGNGELFMCVYMHENDVCVGLREGFVVWFDHFTWSTCFGSKECNGHI